MPGLLRLQTLLMITVSIFLLFSCYAVNFSCAYLLRHWRFSWSFHAFTTVAYSVNDDASWCHGIWHLAMHPLLPIYFCVWLSVVLHCIAWIEINNITHTKHDAKGFWNPISSNAGIFATNVTKVPECVNGCVRFSVKLFSERELRFTFAILCCRPSVCLSSVTLVHPTQSVEIFGNISTPFGT